MAAPQGTIRGIILQTNFKLKAWKFSKQSITASLWGYELTKLIEQRGKESKQWQWEILH